MNNSKLMSKVSAQLAQIFINYLPEITNFRDFEDKVIEVGHSCIQIAFGLALETLDFQLMCDRDPKDNLRVHDKRQRVLATEIGDICFMQRRYRDVYGCDRYLLSEKLDLAYGARLSPGATDMLVSTGTYVSYRKAAEILARRGSRVKATTVMNALRQAGAACKEQDSKEASELYREGVIPESSKEAELIQIEADGTWFSLQNVEEGKPKRCEVKAMCAYSKKEVSGKKVRRVGTFHHALVGSAEELWCEGISGMGRLYNLSKLKRVHLGGDGERWCGDAGRYLPGSTEVTFHLDPFHVNRAILSCFIEKRVASSIIEALKDGDKTQSIKLLKASRALGLANKNAERVITYLESNIDSIYVDGPSLGTMESENQHLYGARMDSVPCGWSMRGASDMARLISRRESGREVPKITREESMSKKRRARRDRKQLSYLSEQGLSVCQVLKSSSRGYEPPHQASVSQLASEVRFSASIDGGMAF
jgi:hypothetical protein